MPQEESITQSWWLSHEKHRLMLVDRDDHYATTNLIIRRLKESRKETSLSVRYTSFTMSQFIDAARSQKTYDLCVPIMEASFEFHWRLISPSGEPNVPTDEFVSFAFGPLILVRCVGSEVS